MKLAKATVALAALASFAALGQATPPLPPLLAITSPTSTVFVPSFPATVPVSIGITMQEFELANLTQFDVSTSDGTNTTSLVPGGQFNPFSQQNACTVPATLTCQTSTTYPTTQATITIPIVISQPGSFPLTVTTKLQRTDGELSDAVNVQLLAVEYPAPPAVANDYINTSGLKSQLNAKQRGCVISQIAQKHAQLSYYGPKGGPYDTTKIQLDVMYILPSCPRY